MPFRKLEIESRIKNYSKPIQYEKLVFFYCRKCGQGFENKIPKKHYVIDQIDKNKVCK